MKVTLGLMNKIILKNIKNYFDHELKKKISFNDEIIPSIKNEEYKYFDLDAILNNEYCLSDKTENKNQETFYNKNLIEKNDKYFDIIVTNNDISTVDASLGIKIEKYDLKNLPQNILDDFSKNQNFFSTISLLASDNIFIIEIDKNFNKNLRIIYNFLSKYNEKSFLSSAIFFDIKDDVSLNFIEYFLDKSIEDDMLLPLICMNILDNSKVSYYRYVENKQAKILSTNLYNLYKGSNLKLVNINLANNILREDFCINLLGEGATGDISSISFSKLKSMVDLFVSVNHKFRKTFSTQDVKSVLYDDSKSAFTGKIEVQKDSQKVKSKQSSKSILLSKSARSFARPWLKIFADDVECSHGATFGELDKSALFYLQSRGIKEEDAKKVLLGAFIFETLSKVDDEGFIKLSKDSLFQDLSF